MTMTSSKLAGQGPTKEPGSGLDLDAELDWEALVEPLGVKDSRSLPKLIRRNVKTPLEALPSLVGPGETIRRLMLAHLKDASGLLVVTDERIFFLDGVSGLLELEFFLDESNATLGDDGVLTVEDHEGIAEFSDFEPSTLPPRPPRTVPRASAAPMRPAVRICDGCGAEFTPILASYTCPDCGGILYPAK